MIKCRDQQVHQTRGRRQRLHQYCSILTFVNINIEICIYTLPFKGLRSVRCFFNAFIHFYSVYNTCIIFLKQNSISRILLEQKLYFK